MTIKVKNNELAIDGVCVKCGVSHVRTNKINCCNVCYENKYKMLIRNRKKKVIFPRIRNKSFEAHLLARIKSKSKKEREVFDIDLDWIKERINRGVCEVTNIPMIIPTYKSMKEDWHRQFYPLIVRINSTKGFVKDNCKIVVRLYSLIKSDSTDQYI